MRLNHSSDMLVDAKTGQDLLVRGPVKAQSILPSQYFDRGAGRSENVGELKLLLANQPLPERVVPPPPQQPPPAVPAAEPRQSPRPELRPAPGFTKG